jgi:hypothetical protein
MKTFRHFTNCLCVLLIAIGAGCSRTPSGGEAVAEKTQLPTQPEDGYKPAPENDGYTPPSNADGFSVGNPGSKPWESAKEIDEATARQAVAIDDSLQFDNVTSLTPSVAQILAQCRHNLTFYSLRSISADVASALAKHEGGMASTGYGKADGLNLRKLQDLPEAVAVALSAHKGTLVIGSEDHPVELLSDGAAIAMGQSKSRFLTLCVAAASAKAQDSLAGYRGSMLHVPTLGTMTSQALLERLLNVPDNSLLVALGVVNLTPDQARTIVDSGKTVRLPKVKDMPIETAKHLVSSRNSIFLYSLQGPKESLELLRTNTKISLP